jgi:hypothetical protein
MIPISSLLHFFFVPLVRRACSRMPEIFYRATVVSGTKALLIGYRKVTWYPVLPEISKYLGCFGSIHYLINNTSLCQEYVSSLYILEQRRVVP